MQQMLMSPCMTSSAKCLLFQIGCRYPSFCRMTQVIRTTGDNIALFSHMPICHHMPSLGLCHPFLAVIVDYQSSQSANFVGLLLINPWLTHGLPFFTMPAQLNGPRGLPRSSLQHGARIRWPVPSLGQEINSQQFNHKRFMKQYGSTW